MDLQTLTSFFMWCTLLNGGLLLLSTVACIALPDFMHRMHRRLFPISRESFTIILYCFLGLMKMLFLIFNVVPFIALLIIG